MSLLTPPPQTLHSLLPKTHRLQFHPPPKTTPPLQITRSVNLSRLLTTEPTNMTTNFYSAIEHLEQHTSDPSDVFDKIDHLSTRELQLVLLHFSQEGRDSYCALEVFDWLKKENRVDVETMELMVSIGCGWIERLIGGEHEVGEVVGLLDEMRCVGVEPGFSMVEKVVGMYWGRGMREEAVAFVECVMRRGVVEGGGEESRTTGGAVGYLAWKMMVDGNYMDAVKLIVEFKEFGLKPDVYSYLIALTALVKEQIEFSKALRKLQGSIKSNLIAELDEESMGHIEKYQSEIIKDAVCLSDWAIQEGGSTISGVVHKRLLAIYTCAGCGLEAERELWQMKISGKEPDKMYYDIVLAICASQKEASAVSRLLAGIEATSAGHRKKTLTWLLRGYVKGGCYFEASETLMKMLDLGLCPEYLDRVAVFQGLRKSIQESGNFESYIKLCKRLSDMELIGPCLVYMYINRYKLWIVKML